MSSPEIWQRIVTFYWCDYSQPPDYPPLMSLDYIGLRLATFLFNISKTVYILDLQFTGLCHNYPVLPLQCKSSHRQYKNKQPHLYSNKTLLIKLDCQSMGYSLLTHHIDWPIAFLGGCPSFLLLGVLVYYPLLFSNCNAF